MNKVKFLLTYRYAEIIHDLTTEFCVAYLSNLSNLSYLRQFNQTIPQKRTIDQMTQAARSGKQNIVEGVGQNETSKKGEIKLLGVAMASFEELLTDFEDFLRQRKMTIYFKNHPKVLAFRQTACRLSHLSNLSDLGELKEKAKLTGSPEEDANFLLTLCHMETYLLDRQIKALEEKFTKEGGISEKLFRNRTEFLQQLRKVD